MRWLVLLLLIVAQPVLASPQTVEVVLSDTPRRELPVTVIVPEGKVRGLILFSTGAFSSPAKYRAILDPWAAKGYAIVAPLHADSEAWTGPKPSQAESLPWRLADIKLTLSNLPKLERAAGKRFAKQPLIASGHSFGGLIAGMIEAPRLKGVIAWSPPGPFPGLTLPLVKVPMLTITGTADVIPPIAPKWEDHLVMHERATGFAMAYVGDGADHYYGNIFGRTERPGPPASAAFDEAMLAANWFLDRLARKTGSKRKLHPLHTMSGQVIFKER